MKGLSEVKACLFPSFLCAILRYSQRYKQLLANYGTKIFENINLLPKHKYSCLKGEQRSWMIFILVSNRQTGGSSVPSTAGSREPPVLPLSPAPSLAQQLGTSFAPSTGTAPARRARSASWSCSCTLGYLPTSPDMRCASPAACRARSHNSSLPCCSDCSAGQELPTMLLFCSYWPSLWAPSPIFGLLCTWLFLPMEQIPCDFKNRHR